METVIAAGCSRASKPAPPGFTRRTIQGVDYYQAQSNQTGDIFLTEFGLPFAVQLQPDNWYCAEWFEANRFRLRGTSMIYRTKTMAVNGRAIDIVVRFSRVGQDLPIDTLTRDLFSHATFNSPFEEFAELMVLRASRFGPQRLRIFTKRPLAIFSPQRRMELWQSGRSVTEIASKQARLADIQLDITRPYLLVYGWIKGCDLQEAAEQYELGGLCRGSLQGELTAEVERELHEAGFRVLDMKPAHIIVRFDASGRLKRRKDGRLVYALVDYELLERE